MDRSWFLRAPWLTGCAACRLFTGRSLTRARGRRPRGRIRGLFAERLEDRTVPATFGPDLVGVVRAGDLYLAGDQQSPFAAQARPFGQTGGKFLFGDWDGDGKVDVIFTHPNAEG